MFFSPNSSIFFVTIIKKNIIVFLYEIPEIQNFGKGWGKFKFRIPAVLESNACVCDLETHFLQVKFMHTDFKIRPMRDMYI